jgi:hypothetical protein
MAAMWSHPYDVPIMSRPAAKFLCAVTLGVVCACSDEEPSPKSCTLSACGGVPVVITFTDDKGEEVAASGMVRDVGNSTDPWAFNCAADPPEARFPLGCDQGVLSVAAVGPSSKFEVQFELPDGSQSNWQSIVFNLTERTFEDFNGPGCDCTVHEGNSEPITVPSASN